MPAPDAASSAANALQLAAKALSAGTVQNGHGSRSNALIVIGDRSLTLTADRRLIFWRELAPERRVKSEIRHILPIVSQKLPLFKYAEWHTKHDRSHFVVRKTIRSLHTHRGSFDHNAFLEPSQVERMKRPRHII